MPFEEQCLGNVATLIMGQSPKGDTYNKDGVGLPLLNGPTEYGTIHPNCTLFTTDSKRESEPGDLLFCVRGSTTGRMNWGDRKYSIGRGVGSIRGETITDTKFIRYCIEEKLDHLLKLAGGGTFPNLTRTDILGFPIPFPPHREVIVTILSAYDNLIENNLQRIKILEEMAQNLYREWFVNFRFPGHEKVRMVDSSLGKIPEGWLESFPNFVNFKEGPGLRKWQYRKEGIPFLNIRTLINNDIDFSKIQYLETEEAESSYQHFLLQEYDHVVSSSGTLGRIVTIQKQHLPLMLNTSIIRMRPRNNKVGKWQLKCFLLSDYFQNQIRAFAIGSAQLNYGPSHLKQMFIITPNEIIGNKFEDIISPLEEMIILLVRRNSNLRITRDLLLPKLISGVLDVSELDIEIKDEVA